MASICARARRTLQPSTVFATRNAVSKLSGSNVSQYIADGAGGASKFRNSAARLSLRRLFTSSRLPLELGCAESLIPLHSATASALFTSLLSLHSQSWGCLSEGFATPL